ncbi:copper resistance system multicopper oxidase [Ketobacter alkanivorans]|jgi:CopA family copper-resistance protein|uniref:Copper resistance protein CopA n=1 Tax=Ketobacter alkanivorans TaxID=1917421 RepID=A0A2K9LFV1_9GAMM|nr:copper resistance system multicopper oxidase [Ketobacter alkanivorans]MAR90958.1 copper resistance protein CopA [Pseudomonadales bacterium]HAG93502.1 copper resistance system multicopper oxidase [Gammaproteobacteria bacterium]AUM11107.1 copper resistance protein CopA [Ketobacter alkanivorans]MAR91831.1 copper resistance protein CopA [Pseudomonadales bacterium]MAR93427.1 copper resistance protein CopA [Pseudomonadales bacterium]|tara:strand:- start:43800 stop:45614 length:1815 start_codon:yes stop_codon:yes gene_type:complete
MTKSLNRIPDHLTRRRFVQGVAIGGVLGLTPGWLQAGAQIKASLRGHNNPPVLSGREINLVVAENPVNFTGVTRMATTINGSIPAPTLRLREGDEVTIRVTNRLSVPTSIHWHGILLPYQMDGVPGISFPGIAPGETFTYRFKLRQSGTYWYHSHSGFQEMTGMYGALIIEPRTGERHPADQDHVIQLSDWTDEDPMHVFSKLKVQSDIYNFSQPTFFDFSEDVASMGLQAALGKRRMWNQMRMNPTDLADLSAATMTFLMNGAAPAGNWTGLFNKGDRVRLRFINAASNSFYDVRIPGLKLTVIQADGQDVEPVTVDEFRFGPGETYDVVAEPREDAYTIFAQSIDRSGYARGTLATRPGLDAPVPELDPVEWLTMRDMMGAMNHGNSDGGMDHSQMDHGQHQHLDMHDMTQGKHQLKKPSSTVRHARTEYGPSVDMRVDMPRTNLDDPGIGLRDLRQKGLRPKSHRVLTLADLKSIDGILADRRPPAKELELHLTGNMERYSWSFDGLEFGQSTPVSLRHNERVRIILQNDTMMTHPMHLHGMWSELETDQGELRVRRHTIPVQPAQRISFLTTPHDLGRWAWHCHLLFHMDAGMFREVVVS